MSKIVLVDDDEVMVELLTTLLDMEGHQVLTPTIDKAILEFICQEKPDVVLIDVYLRSAFGNKINGLNLLDQIRQRDELQTTKVIMSSGIDFHDESIDKGADAFLHKPYMPETLMKMIANK